MNSPSPAALLDTGLARGDSTGSHAESDHYFTFTGSGASVAGPSTFSRRPTDLLQAISTYEGDKTSQLELQPEAEEEDQYWEDEEEDENLFVNFSLLSHIAVQLRDKVPRGTHVKGSIPYPRAFTGKDIVVCAISSALQFHLSPISVYDTVSNTTRVSYKSRVLHKRSASRASSRSKSAKSAVFL